MCAGPYVGPQQMYSLRDVVILVAEKVHFKSNDSNIFVVLLTLIAPITTKVVCFFCLIKFLEASMANSVDPDQTAPIGAV